MVQLAIDCPPALAAPPESVVRQPRPSDQYPPQSFSGQTASGRHWPLLAAAPLTFLAALLFFAGLGDRELSSSHEARAGQNAAVILETGQWGLPRLFDEQLELQKPPLYYWLVTLIALVRGTVDAWAIRVPAALAALVCVVLVFAFLCRNGRPAAGLVAALVLATCWHFTWLARVGRIDMPLTCAVTAAIGCFHLGGATWPWRLGGYVAVALGVLLKGPIAIVLVAVVAGGMLLIESDDLRPKAFFHHLKRVANRSWVWGAAVVALIAGPWFVWANAQTDGKLWDVFVVYHNFERGFGSETLAMHPWWFYCSRIWVDTFPWSLLLPAAVFLVWRRRWWRDDALCRLGLVWFLSIFLLLSLLRFKRADYLLPAFPGLAVFLGSVGVRWWHSSRPRWAPVALAFVVGAYATGWIAYGYAQDGDCLYRAAAERIRAHAGPETPVIFFRAEVHPLAFHLRRPLGTIREWENLEIWANEPRLVFFVMPAEWARQWPEHLLHGRLESVFSLYELLDAKHDRDLMVLRNR